MLVEISHCSFFFLRVRPPGRYGAVHKGTVSCDYVNTMWTTFLHTNLQGICPHLWVEIGQAVYLGRVKILKDRIYREL
jgi:hypothetical protein